MALTQKLKDFAKDSLETIIPLAPIGVVVAVMYVGSIFLPAKENSKILPYEQGGLPFPFATMLVDDPHVITYDDNGERLPFDRTLLHGIGPGGTFIGAERLPTQPEINYWNSH